MRFRRGSAFAIVAAAALSFAGSGAACTPFKPADDSDAGGVNLLMNPDFELPGCGLWTGNDVTTQDDPVAHSAKTSCRVCGKAGVNTWSLSQDVDVGAIAMNSRYVGEVWVRAPATGDVAKSITVDIMASDPAGAAADNTRAEAAPLTATWTKVLATVKVSHTTATRVSLAIVGRTSGGCFLVDDASLTPYP